MENENVNIMFLVNQDFSFVTRSVSSFLEKAGEKIQKSNISIKALTGLSELPRILVTEAELLKANDEARVFLYDFCIEKGSKLVIIGESDELSELMEITNPSIVSATYERPINAQELAGDLISLKEKIKLAGMRKRILIVDDSPTFLRTASEWLENDYNVNVCPSATAAFHMLEANRPDLILLDYEMPVCNGMQFLEMLHSEVSTSDIPVIFLTSRSDPATVKCIVNLKPQGYLLKTQPKENILQYIGDFFTKEKSKH